MSDGTHVLTVSRSNPFETMASEVLQGLSSPPRWISSTYFYDAQGSMLYEQITNLAEYYATRAEAHLLQQIVPELSQNLTASELIELGSGSSRKTRILLSALAKEGKLRTYIPIDVSPSMLVSTAKRLSDEYPFLKIMALAGTYEEALAALPPAAERTFLFLGGTIGNLTAPMQDAFFARLAQVMQPGHQLLLGFDRSPNARKPVELILRAYNDSQGITAQFNLNLLARLNRDLDTNFRLDTWCHRAVYAPSDNQIEMRLDCLDDQEVFFPHQKQKLSLRRGESILTEISRKFAPQQLADWFEARGFHCQASWTDEAQLVGLLLLRRC